MSSKWPRARRRKPEQEFARSRHDPLRPDGIRRVRASAASGTRNRTPPRPRPELPTSTNDSSRAPAFRALCPSLASGHGYQPCVPRFTPPLAGASDAPPPSVSAPPAEPRNPAAQAPLGSPSLPPTPHDAHLASAARTHPGDVAPELQVPWPAPRWLFMFHVKPWSVSKGYGRPAERSPPTRLTPTSPPGGSRLRLAPRGLAASGAPPYPHPRRFAPRPRRVGDACYGNRQHEALYSEDD